MSSNFLLLMNGNTLYPRKHSHKSGYSSAHDEGTLAFHICTPFCKACFTDDGPTPVFDASLLKNGSLSRNQPESMIPRTCILLLLSLRMAAMASTLTNTPVPPALLPDR